MALADSDQERFRLFIRDANFAKRTKPLELSSGKWMFCVIRTARIACRSLNPADALALEMGNSADVIFRHYRRPVNVEVGSAAR